MNIIDRECPGTDVETMQDLIPHSDYCYKISDKQKTFDEHQNALHINGISGQLVVMYNEQYQQYFADKLEKLAKDNDDFKNKNVYIGYRGNFDIKSKFKMGQSHCC